MRDNCEELRDLAIVDMLASTGMRIGEMVLLNMGDRVVPYAQKLYKYASETAEMGMVAEENMWNNE